MISKFSLLVFLLLTGLGLRNGLVLIFTYRANEHAHAHKSATYIRVQFIGPKIMVERAQNIY